MHVPMFLWKHIPNVEIFEHHLYRCGNTSLTHTRLQYFFIFFYILCDNTNVFMLEVYIYFLNRRAFPCFLYTQQETDLRSTPTTAGNARI